MAAVFVMTPQIQRHCHALIALHALHFSGHAAVAITQDQLLLDMLKQEILAAEPGLAPEELAKRANTKAARVLALVVMLGPGLGALLVSPLVAGLADAYGRRSLGRQSHSGVAPYISLTIRHAKWKRRENDFNVHASRPALDGAGRPRRARGRPF